MAKRCDVAGAGLFLAAERDSASSVAVPAVIASLTAWRVLDSLDNLVSGRKRGS